MSKSVPTLMDPRAAATVLMASLKEPRTPRTVADAAAESGLPLRDADRGLHWLTSEYRGHLRVTEEGQLLFFFPYAFTKPWETRDAMARLGRSILGVLGGVARFVVRAWLAIAVIGYAVLFLALAIGLMFARQNDNNRNNFPGAVIGQVVLRVLADALFWTFHPFSPFYSPITTSYDDGFRARGFRTNQRGRESRDPTPFYEKVNRFVFGPPPAKEDALANERRILAEIRAQKGRIGLGDVMRVTGLPREEADPMMSRLMLDYEGDVDVSEEGGITYRFEALRKTAADTTSPRPPPVWQTPKRLPPLTGNEGGSNFLIAALNGFNLVMGAYALAGNWTIARIVHLFEYHPPGTLPTPMPYDGVPIVLGLVPFLFSLALFVLPLGRALLRPITARKVAHENGRIGLLRAILTRIEARAPLTDDALRDAWKQAAGADPSPGELSRSIASLGGDVEPESGEVRYRFVDLETEAAALDAERDAAPEEEARIGKVVFGSDR